MPPKGVEAGGEPPFTIGATMKRREFVEQLGNVIIERRSVEVARGG
jgi:hypothetical protein